MNDRKTSTCIYDSRHLKLSQQLRVIKVSVLYSAISVVSKV